VSGETGGRAWAGAICVRLPADAITRRFSSLKPDTMRAAHSVLRVVWLPALFVAAACQRTILPPPVQTPGAGQPLASSTPERSAVLKELSGSAEMRADASGEWAATSAGLILGVGNQLRTGADSRAFVQLTEGSKIRLDPETAITFNFLNPYLDSLLTALALDGGQVWLLLTSNSALDVETPLGIASARGAYMNVAYDPATQTLSLMCLQGTCSLNQSFIPPNFKYRQSGAAPTLAEPMQLADYGRWGLSVPEATQFVPYATEAAAQGNATLPVIAAITEATPTPEPATATPSETATTEAGAATPTLAEPPTAAPPTAPPATPRPAATPLPAIGQHRVLPGETVFCLARVYGVQPDAIIQANDLPRPYLVQAGQLLRIPAAPWSRIDPGPVCAPQFQSPYPGLPYEPPTSEPPTPTDTPAAPPTAAPPLEIREVAALCIGNCDDPAAPTYRLLIIVTVAGGAEPLTFDPGQQYQLDFDRCVKSSGVVTVTSADGQVATGSWVYDDTACPTPTAGP